MHLYSLLGDLIPPELKLEADAIFAVTLRNTPTEYVTLEPVLTAKGYVTNRDIRQALGVSASHANRIVRDLTTMGWLRPEGEKRGTRKALAA